MEDVKLEQVGSNGKNDFTIFGQMLLKLLPTAILIKQAIQDWGLFLELTIMRSICVLRYG